MRSDVTPSSIIASINVENIDAVEKVVNRSRNVNQGMEIKENKENSSETPNVADEDDKFCVRSFSEIHSRFSQRELNQLLKIKAQSKLLALRLKEKKWHGKKRRGLL